MIPGPWRKSGAPRARPIHWSRRGCSSTRPSGIRREPATPTSIREGVRNAKADGVDGLKIFAINRQDYEVVLDEAHKLGMRTQHHLAVSETTARDAAELGVTSLEHFYGVADAALDGIQNFPPGSHRQQRNPPFRPRRRTVHPAEPQPEEALRRPRSDGQE